MKKAIIITILSLISTFSLLAQSKGFAAKIYNDSNIHIMNVIVDYNNRKVKVQTNGVDMEFKIILTYKNTVEVKQYIKVVQTALFNSGNYKDSDTETLIFDLSKLLFTSSNAEKTFSFEIYELAKPL